LSAETEDLQFGLAHSIVETLPIINKPEHTKKRGEYKGKMKIPSSKKTKEP